MRHLPLVNAPPRALSQAEEGMVNFLLARRHGFPTPDQLANISISERDAVVTEDVGLEWSRFYVELARLSKEELIRNFEKERDKLEDEVRVYSSRLSESDLASWMHKDGWHPEEALALTFGCRPTTSLVSWSQANKHLHHWAANIVNVHDLILRALSIKVLRDPITSQQYITWASGKPFELPRFLSKGVTFKHELAAKIAHVESENETLRNEIQALKSQLRKNDGPEYINLLEMFGAVCRGVYGFDRKKPRNTATRDIASAIETYTNLIGGITANARDKFVRKRIQEGMNALERKHRIQIDSEGTLDPSLSRC